jgi:hypothetical protein
MTATRTLDNSWRNDIVSAEIVMACGNAGGLSRRYGDHDIRDIRAPVPGTEIEMPDPPALISRSDSGRTGPDQQ